MGSQEGDADAEFGVLDIYQGSIPVKEEGRSRIGEMKKSVSMQIQQTLQGALEHILPVRVAHIGSKLMGLYIPI